MDRIRLALIFILLALSAANAETKGDAATGRQIAERWCAACHIVSPEQTSGIADVLTFKAIAEKTGDHIGQRQLAAFLTDPHPVMPNYSLTNSEIRDLVAYISSLR